MVTSIPLSKYGKKRNQFEAIVDDCDAEFLMQFNWCVSRSSSQKTHYATRNHYPENAPIVHIKMHRIVLERILGRPLEKWEFPDHVNRNGLDNRRENIRLVNRAQNSMNTTKNVNNTSGYKGVTWNKFHGKFQAQITQTNPETRKKKKIHIGYFENPEDAYKAYCKKVRELHGDVYRPE